MPALRKAVELGGRVYYSAGVVGLAASRGAALPRYGVFLCTQTRWAALPQSHGRPTPKTPETLKTPKAPETLKIPQGHREPR